MLRLTLATIFTFAISNFANAHFLFVVPGADRSAAQVILSEDLQPDENIEVEIVDAAKLWIKKPGGVSDKLELKKADEAVRSVDLPKEVIDAGPVAVIHGIQEFGVSQRGDSPPFLLVYHPKTILGDAFSKDAQLGDATPVELIPVGKAGELRFQLLAKGAPVADSELTVILPNGDQEQATTDSEGTTKTAFKAPGRYGVWARYFEDATGKHDGKDYKQMRHYPTLVVDVKDAAAAPSNQQTTKHETLTPLPEATSSFGAVASGDWLYVYGGHIARTHNYSTEAVSGKFFRLNLKDGAKWEELPGGVRMQGMNLAARDGKIYRVGGMVPKNKPGDPVDNHSTDECVVFDPETKQWEPIRSLPVPRSSHDIAVVGDKLYVIGGWDMSGDDGEEWLDEGLVLDLSGDPKTAEWKSFKQPFERRALIVAVQGEKIYVLGGFDSEDVPSLNVDIYNTATGEWTSGPKLPGKALNGFAPAACEADGDIYVSVGDGNLYRLNDAEDGWDHITKTTPRIVHRMAKHGKSLLVLGGAARGGNFDLIEVVDIDEPAAASSGE